MIRSPARTSVLLALLAAVSTLLPGSAGAQQGVPVTQVAVGADHTCALTAAGGAQCWGGNTYGQLGDDSTSGHPVPADVSGLTSGVVSLAAGERHSCALTTGGGVKCWGSNQFGEVGDGTGAPRLTPVDVTGLTSGVAAIAARRIHTCALTAAGGVRCWGYNFYGQLGDDSNTNRPAPVDVVGLSSGVAAIAAGDVHTCALTNGGGVKCWGWNDGGQLGDTTTAQRRTPVDVVGLGSGMSAISAGIVHTCALTVAGGVKCWGFNLNGQLGDGLTANRPFPGDVSGLGAGVVAIAAGGDHTCALTDGGGVKCWGRNDGGQLGDNQASGTRSLVPVDVAGLASGVAAITAGIGHSCALTTGGNVKCWGSNFSGQLGDATTGTVRIKPVGVSGLSTTGIAMLAAGQSHTCALTLAGGVKCWGFNNKGQLGNDSTAQSFTPVDASGLTSGVATIASSKFHTCAVTTGGGVKCWGENVSGSLGDDTGTDRHVPTDVFGLASGMADVTIGPNHACAISTNGAASCWGANIDGRLGDGTNSQRFRPSPVVQASPFLSISAGYTHTCALVFGGVVQCWGNNVGGQLGDPALIPPNRNVPGNVVGLPDVSQLETGADHTCVRTLGSGGLKCWGRNAEGQLGDGTLTPRPSPVDVTGLASGVAVLSTGDYHTCALTLAGGVKCWGDNFYAELGDGTTTHRELPTDVVGLATGIVDIDAAYSQTCALTAAGGVKCWGYNLNGQLGDGSTSTRNTPVGALIGGQSIAFAPPPALTPGASAPLAAVASSGLAVAFDTWTPGTCVVSGNSVTAISVGLCGLRASQAGNGAVSAAPSQMRLVPVLDALADLDNDGIPNAVESPEGRNALVKDNDVFTVNRLFAMQQYRDFLGREGDAGGITYYTNLLDANPMLRAPIIESFFNSPEFAGTASPVVRLYFAFFNRIPDYAGFQFQVNALRAGTPLTVIANNFSLSGEFVAAYGALTDAQYVTLLYQNVLGRTAAQAEIDYHVNRLASGATRGEVMAGFSESPEFVAGTFDKVYVVMMYVGMLRRSPEQAGFDYWVNYLGTGNPGINLILGFLNAPEYRNRFLP